METLTFEINKTSISLTNSTLTTPYLTGRNTDYVCIFDVIGDDWDGLTKKATFRNLHSNIKKTRFLANGSCHIPFGVLTYGTLEVGLVGLDGNETIKSSLLYRLSVQRDAGENDEDMPDPDPSILDEIMAKIAACDKGVVSGGIDPTDNHLYVNLTNGDRVDFGEMATGSDDKQLDDIYVDANGNIIIKYADGTEKTSSAAGLPPAGAGDLNNVMQVGQNGWQSQPLELDDGVVHILTNLEIEELLNNFV